MNNCKYLLLTLLLCPFFCAANPFFIGIDAGETNSHLDAEAVAINQAETRTLGFGGRIYGGWQYDQHLSFEAGYLYFKPTRFNQVNNTGLTGQVSEQSLDISLKATLPFANGYRLFARFGVACMTATPDAVIRNASRNDYQKSTVMHARPFLGLGTGYAINQRVTVEAAWSHVLQHRAIPGASLLAVGLRYFFI